jgi:DNA-binding GntR family transcriptional regulator
MQFWGALPLHRTTFSQDVPTTMLPEVVESSTIARPSLYGEVVTRLRDMIVHGEMPPGERIPERVLCERFGISRTPLRESLKVLAAEGLVELLPHRGARVAEFRSEDVVHLFEMMGALEALSGELAAQRMTQAELEALRAVHARMADAYARRDLRTYFDCNQEIHERIVAAARNPVLRDSYNALSGRIRRARYAANMSDERWAAAMAEHETMLAALGAHDSVAMADILRRHLRNKCEAVVNAFP